MLERAVRRARVRSFCASLCAVSLLMVGFGAADATPAPARPPLWNNAGHQIVCEIAWSRLSDQSRARVAELIALDPTYDTFAASCVWADEVRLQIRMGVEGMQRLDRYTPAHYINTPRGMDGVDREGCTQVRPDGSESICVLDGIAEVGDNLRSGATVELRLEALKFLGHFVGDVHQPLHAGYGDDRGGNSFAVSIMGLPDRNLHGAWDFFFLEHGGRPWRELAADLASRITPVDARLWASLDPAEWADESYQLVEREVYAGLDRDGAYIGGEYYDRHIATVERQLMKAGVRLALLLEALLDT